MNKKSISQYCAFLSFFVSFSGPWLTAALLLSPLTSFAEGNGDDDFNGGSVAPINDHIPLFVLFTLVVVFFFFLKKNKMASNNSTK